MRFVGELSRCKKFLSFCHLSGPEESEMFWGKFHISTEWYLHLSQPVASTTASDLTLSERSYVQTVKLAERRSVLCCFWSDQIQRHVCWPEESPGSPGRRVWEALSGPASTSCCLVPVDLGGSFLRLFTFRMEIRTVWLPGPDAS